MNHSCKHHRHKQLAQVQSASIAVHRQKLNCKLKLTILESSSIISARRESKCWSTALIAGSTDKQMCTVAAHQFCNTAVTHIINRVIIYRETIHKSTLPLNGLTGSLTNGQNFSLYAKTRNSADAAIARYASHWIHSFQRAKCYGLWTWFRALTVAIDACRRHIWVTECKFPISVPYWSNT